MTPDQIPLGFYTHINFAFALVDPVTFNIAPMGADVAALYDQVTNLKQKQPDLKVWITIGGWAMNDPGPTQTTFSDLAGSASAQSNFFNSLITFMKAHGFDGVDIDWLVHLSKAPTSCEDVNRTIFKGVSCCTRTRWKCCRQSKLFKLLEETSICIGWKWNCLKTWTFYYTCILFHIYILGYTWLT